MSKIAVGSFLTLSLLFVSSCGQPQKADSKDVLSSARTNFATYLSGDFAKDMHLAESGQTTGTFSVDYSNEDTARAVKAKVDGTFDGAQQKVQNGTGTTMNSQLAFQAAAKIESPEASMSGDAKVAAEFRIIGEKLYAIVNDFTVKASDASTQEMIDAQLSAIVSQFAKKWFFADMMLLSGGTTQVQINSEYYSKLADIIKSKEIFEVVKELPSEEGMYVYQVKLQKDNTKELLKGLMALLEIPTQSQITESDMNSLIDELSKDTITHKLYISSNKEYKKFVSTGTVKEGNTNTSFDSTLASAGKGDLNWNLGSTLKEGTTEDKISISVEKKGDKVTAKVDGKMPSSKVNLLIDVQGSFTKKEVQIETPTGASDIMSLAAGLAGGI